MDNGNKVKLFCIPGGGASAFLYLRWSKYLDKNIKLCLLELAGRGLRKNEAAIDNIDELTEDLFQNWKSQMSDDMTEDYILLGYCFGSIAAYELYKRICAEGMKKPVHIFFSASDSADGSVYAKSFFGDRSTKAEVVELLQRYFPEHIFKDRELVTEFSGRYADRLYDLYEQNNRIMPVDYDDISAGNNYDEDMSFQIKKCLEFANETLSILGNDVEIARIYQTTPHDFIKIESDVTILAGKTDTMTPLEDVKGWKRLCGADCKICEIDGGHQLLIDSYERCIPYINEVAVVQLKNE